MSIGAYIRKIRLKKAINQQFIADSIGISQSKFNKIENDKFDVLLNDLIKICQELRINCIVLLQSYHAHQSVENEEI